MCTRLPAGSRGNRVANPPSRPSDVARAAASRMAAFMAASVTAAGGGVQLETNEDHELAPRHSLNFVDPFQGEWIPIAT
jgi:hypothetical protein